jgi:hypothetical protein
MSGKQPSRKKKSSNVHKQSEGNLGQKEARLEKENASELTHMGEKTHKSEEKDQRRAR